VTVLLVLINDPVSQQYAQYTVPTTNSCEKNVKKYAEYSKVLGIKLLKYIIASGI
jgi:hypothetical protein